MTGDGSKSYHLGHSVLYSHDFTFVHDQDNKQLRIINNISNTWKKGKVSVAHSSPVKVLLGMWMKLFHYNALYRERYLWAVHFAIKFRCDICINIYANRNLCVANYVNTPTTISACNCHYQTNLQFTVISSGRIILRSWRISWSRNNVCRQDRAENSNAYRQIQAQILMMMFQVVST